MPDTYIIRAAVDAADTSGISTGDLFICGVNERSEHYPTADAAITAAHAAYKGRAKHLGCRVWAEREAGDAELAALI